MLLTIDGFLTRGEVEQFRGDLRAAPWVDGRTSAGSLATTVKNNEQVDDQSPAARALANQLLRKLGQHPKFIAAALPQRIQPPRFNRYRDSQAYGTHVDGAIMPLAGTDKLMRSDLSATLFLTDPQDYDGGELTIATDLGVQAVKLAAGDLLLYSSNSLHQVRPVTRGERICAFFWVQSMIRDAEARGLLFELDRAIQSIAQTRAPDDPALLRLTSIYHNLARRWADA